MSIKNSVKLFAKKVVLLLTDELLFGRINHT